MVAIYKSEAGGRALTQRYRELLTLWPVASEQLRLAASRSAPFLSLLPNDGVCQR